MASVHEMLKLARASIGPDVTRAQKAKSHPKHNAIIVPSSKEEPVKLSQLDQFLFQNFGKDSPVIPVGVYSPRLSHVFQFSKYNVLTHYCAGVGVTAVILVSGLFSLQANNKPQQQMFMRMRVGAQAITVLAMMASLAVQERQKSLGLFKD